MNGVESIDQTIAKEPCDEKVTSIHHEGCHFVANQTNKRTGVSFKTKKVPVKYTFLCKLLFDSDSLTKLHACSVHGPLEHFSLSLVFSDQFRH